MSSQKDTSQEQEQCATTYVFPVSATPLEGGEGKGKPLTTGEGLPPTAEKGKPPVKIPRKPPLMKASSLGITPATIAGGKFSGEGQSNTNESYGSISNISLSTNQTNQCSSVVGNISSSGVKRESIGVKLPPKSALKGHFRSASHGGVIVQNRNFDPTANSTTITSSGGGGKGVAAAVDSSNFRKGHARAASQGQIVEDQANLKGHQRVASKTDFILPPGHVERESARERERLSITNIWGDTAGAAYNRGHSRQASRSESIYTLRQNKSPIKNRLFFWRRNLATGDESRIRVVVPSHRVPPETKEDQHPNGKYPSNYIRTTKYTAISFLPKNLFEQFHRFANLYFISIVLLNWIPAISAFGKEIAMLPVMFVLGVTAIKDLFEDRRRHLSDKRINNSTCRVYKSELGRYGKAKWKDMRVGDIVHLSCNEMIPADILVLRTNDPNGLCYIETMNLDGESNLKQREVIRGFVEKQSTFQPHEFKSTIEVTPPNTKIYHFSGNIVHPNGVKVPVTKENLLLRDCVLKNTDFIEGIVVYAGKDTKAMLNNGGPRHKRTGLEKLMNLEVMWCVVILAVLCIVGATGSTLWISSYDNSNSVPFFQPSKTQRGATEYFYEAFLSCLTFIIILQVMIPLSLYVTIELTKLMQIYHIHCDIELYDPETNKRIECRAMNIPEDLGQIQYVFSDKTGTLTENKMMFRRCTIGGIDFNHAQSEQLKNRNINPPLKINSVLNEQLLRLNSQISMETGYSQAHRIRDFFMNLAVCNTVVVAKYPHHDQMNASGLIVDPSSSNHMQYSRLPPIKETSNSVYTIKDNNDVLIEYSKETEDCGISGDSGSRRLNSIKRPRLLDFPSQRPLSPISSSNETTPTESPAQRPRFLQIQQFSIISRFSKNFQVAQPQTTPILTPSPSEFKPIFEAESPDELALVEAAYAYNCKLLKRTPQNVKVAFPGDSPIDYEIMHVFPFDSVRKRMSIVLKDPKTHEIIMYTKGADSTIFPRLKFPVDQAQRDMIEQTDTLINNYSREGLRILLMAKRSLNEHEYGEWASKFKLAEIDLNNREALMFDCYNMLEDKLDLIGATGIEDRLQDGVPETIEALRKAGIVIWVLTGDKQETAVNIAYSCKLFTPNMDIIKLNTRRRESAEKILNFYIEQAEKMKSQEDETMHINSAKSEFSRRSTMGSTSEAEPVPLIFKERALVVDGKTLTCILDQRANLLSKFLTLSRHCSAVLCCRSTPLQKAYIVNSVKDQLGMRTLAIGDGANDVSMIQRADVGVGISGKEGMQAVMASDFAISKFKYLERLLLVHGHWCYDRLARMILYFFYKNAAFVFVIFWYQLLNGWSGSVMIDQMYLMVFNLFFTALPPMAIGIYDQDAPSELLLSVPKLYRQGRLQKVHQGHSFWLNMLDSLYQSIVIFFMAYGAYIGSDVGMYEFGTTIVISCLFTMLVHMAIEAKSWTIIHVFSIFVSIIIFYAFAFVYNSICISCLNFENPYWIIHELVATPIHWFTVVITTVLAVLPRLVIRTIESSIFPSDVTKAILLKRQSSRQDEELFVSWSRSTSTSSVFKERVSWLCCRNKGNKKKLNRETGRVVNEPFSTVT